MLSMNAVKKKLGN